MMGSDRLLPCPFCGTDEPILSNNERRNWEVFCRKCGASVFVQRGQNETDAKIAWNQRTQVPTTNTAAPPAPDFTQEWLIAHPEYSHAPATHSSAPWMPTPAPRVCPECGHDSVSLRSDGTCNHPTVNEYALAQGKPYVPCGHKCSFQSVSVGEAVAAQTIEWYAEAMSTLREMYDMVQAALSSRDALLISRNCATMLKVEAVLGIEHEHKEGDWLPAPPEKEK